MAGFGINYFNDPKTPHILVLDAIDSKVTPFQYRLQNGVSYDLPGPPYLVDVQNWDDGSATRVAMAPNKYYVHRWYSFTSNALKIQYAQNEYNSLAEAEDNMLKEVFITEPSIKSNGMLIAYMIVKRGATDLSDSKQAYFLQAGRFASTPGS